MKRVWVYITGVTNHHQNSRPQSMQRIAGTNVWRWRTRLNANWRGPLLLYSTERDDILSVPSPIASNCEKAGENYTQGVADPLNPQSWKGGRGHAVSALETPQAPLHRDGLSASARTTCQKKLSEK
ncbi:enterochelin esterase domain-containing protein [Shigella flexneri]